MLPVIFRLTFLHHYVDNLHDVNKIAGDMHEAAVAFSVIFLKSCCNFSSHSSFT